MKTLDEVIEAIEVCRDSYVAGKIIKADALHYLKEYRKLDSLDAVAFPEDDNPALSWDELKTMEGKPVWVEVDGEWWGRFWAFVEVESDSYINFFQKGQEYPEDLWKSNMGKTWNAYRKERK